MTAHPTRKNMQITRHHFEIATFAFLCFLYFRISSAAAFRNPMDIFACALLTPIVLGVVYLAIASGKFFVLSASHEEPFVRWWRAFIVSTLASIAFVVAAYFVSFGFSQRLFSSLYWRRWDDFFEQDLVLFALLFSMPALAGTLFWFRSTIRQNS